MKRIRLFHIYKDSLMAEAMHGLMETSLSCSIVGTASDVRKAVPSVAEVQPDIVVCGVSLPEIDPVLLQRGLKQAGLQTPVFVFTAEARSSAIREALAAGVAGYVVSAETTAQGLGLALQSVCAGLTVLGPSAKNATRFYLTGPDSPATLTSGVRQEKDTPDLLTEREQVILALIIEGLSNKQIAGRLGIGLRTAQLHMSRLLAKLGARSKVEVVRIALERQLRSAQRPG